MWYGCNAYNIKKKTGWNTGMNEKEERAKIKLRTAVNKSTKLIKHYIIIMIGLYIGFALLTDFMHFDKSIIEMIILVLLALIILGSLMYVVFMIRNAKKALEDVESK